MLNIKSVIAVTKKNTKELKQVEDKLQKAVEQYLKLKNIRYIHLPKNSQRFIWNKKYGIPAYVAAEASRALKGVPDLILFGKDQTYLLIELKSEKGKLTPEQKTWLEYGMVVYRDFDSLQELIDKWDKLHNN